MANALRDIYGQALMEIAENNNDIVVLDADVSGSTKSAIFGAAYPERFYNCGISEYAMVGMAAGMAASGKIPFVNTFAVFLTTIGLLGARTFMSYAHQNIKLMGAYGGMSDSYDGATHHALEDISYMRSLAGIDVYVASDEFSTKWMIENAVEDKTPMYIRLSREAMPIVHSADTQFEKGKGIVVHEGNDVTVFACGIMVGFAIEAAEILEKENISVRVVDMYCIKPIDRDIIKKCAAETGAVVTAEEHSIIGGLGSAVCEVIATENCNVPVNRIGMNDCHGESGDYKQLLHKYKLDTDAIVASVKDIILKKWRIN